MNIPKRVTAQIFDQIMDIRDSGVTNMFDTKRVFEIAVEKGFNELADLIFMNTTVYTNFILTGNRGVIEDD